MGKVICISNCKGGTAKTTSCVNLGVGLVREGYKVLLVDIDPQGSLTGCLKGTDKYCMTLADILRKTMDNKEFDAKAGILHHEEKVDFVPADYTLADLDLQLKEEYGGEWILKEFIEKVRSQYDYILLDCQPTLNYLTLNAFCAADSLIVPMEASYLSLMGLEQMLEQVHKMRKRLNPSLKIEGILITRINERTTYARDIIDILRAAYGSNIRIFNSRIPRSVKVEECSAEGISIFLHDPEGKVAKAYEALAKEVIGHEE